MVYIYSGSWEVECKSITSIAGWQPVMPAARKLYRPRFETHVALLSLLVAGTSQLCRDCQQSGPQISWEASAVDYAASPVKLRGFLAVFV